ncbi:hypothetical protein C1645_842527 [Glomus cerebriforme]|uniref:Uncharacterized protein n=1 Tax=Glomus cerebriforme TaxID=658196 RepID=A0A397S8T5_9GLOM|nr:hypothetical protein C1645_842527 [Glomus cerebriforme]
MDSLDSLDSLLSKINQVVNNKSQTPSLNNNSIPRASGIIRDGYEPIKLEGTDKVFSPIISNKDNSDTKKTQQKNNSNSESFIEHELSSKEHNLEVLSQQSSSQPPSLFPTNTAGRKSTIAEQTNILTTKQQSELDSQLLRPITALSRSSSSDGSVSLKESEVSDLSISVEEKFDKEDNCVTKKSRHVYSNNRDVLPKILKDQVNFSEQVEPLFVGETGEQITSDNSTISTNIIIPTTHILSSNHSSSEYSTSSLSIHSDNSILGDIVYNNIAIPSSSPSSSTISNISSPPLRNTKLHREDKYPSPGAYFSHKSGPMGDLSGGLSPNKRVNLIYIFFHIHNLKI